MRLTRTGMGKYPGTSGWTGATATFARRSRTCKASAPQSQYRLLYLLALIRLSPILWFSAFAL